MTSRVMVFSHPNHEVAVLGSIRRWRPHMVFLTDGGGTARVAQTRAGLAEYAPQSMTFLDCGEQQLYNALLNRDVSFYRQLAARLRAVFENLAPDAVYCDAVEFYNPVHDMTLPIVRSALEGTDVPVFEVPLIYQKAAQEEGYELQRLPAALEGESVWVELTHEEFTRKVATLQANIYQALFSQLGGIILQCIPSHAAREQYLAGRHGLPSPVAGQALRYDRRGKMLQENGAIQASITYAGHYVPMFNMLCPQMPRLRNAVGQ